MSAIDLTTGTLPASKTHASRRWSFVPAGEGAHRGLGTVCIHQGKRDSQSYGVDVADGQVLFCKLTGEADVYGVTCDRAGKPVKCSCTGFCFKKTCKHADTARELIADGLVAVG